MVGPWCFLDHIGPVQLPSGSSGLHVGEHPHTCLQTFTWMITGQILHRDSLGTEQVIRPGQVNLMTAGHGIAHTEDSLPNETALHAVQLWIALPPEQADIAPAFQHYDRLPVRQVGMRQGVSLTVLAGCHDDLLAPTQVYSPMVAFDLHAMQADQAELTLDTQFEYGVLLLQGKASLNGQALGEDTFAYCPPGATAMQLALDADARCMVVGGVPFAQPVTLWWNFVGHSRQAVMAAQDAWESGSQRFGRVPGSNTRLAAPPLPWSR
jgi:hypothetical protein